MGARYGPVYKVPFGRKFIVIISDIDAAMKALRERPHDFTRSRVIRPLFAELGFVGYSPPRATNGAGNDRWSCGRSTPRISSGFFQRW